MNTEITSSHEHIDLPSLNKTNLLEEAISMKIQLNANKHTESIMSVFLDKLMGVTTKITILENTVAELQETNKIMNIELENCKKRNKKLSSNYDELCDEIYYMQKDISRVDQYSRRQNIDLSGIPKSIPHGKLKDKVIEILGKIWVVVKPEEIVAVHRLNGKRYPNVIIRFYDRNKVYACLKNKKELSRIKEYNLYMTENLCENYKSIYDECTKLKAEGKIKRLWTTNGVVNFKFKDDDEKVTKVFHILDLDDHFDDTEKIDDANVSDFDIFNDGWDPRYEW